MVVNSKLMVPASATLVLTSVTGVPRLAASLPNVANGEGMPDVVLKDTMSLQVTAMHTIASTSAHPAVALEADRMEGTCECL
jgi:hypothetical protein